MLLIVRSLNILHVTLEEGFEVFLKRGINWFLVQRTLHRFVEQPPVNVAVVGAQRR